VNEYGDIIGIVAQRTSVNVTRGSVKENVRR
jgi:hypothetical protein